MSSEAHASYWKKILSLLALDPEKFDRSNLVSGDTGIVGTLSRIPPGAEDSKWRDPADSWHIRFIHGGAYLGSTKGLQSYGVKFMYMAEVLRLNGHHISREEPIVSQLARNYRKTIYCVPFLVSLKRVFEREGGDKSGKYAQYFQDQVPASTKKLLEASDPVEPVPLALMWGKDKANSARIIDATKIIENPKGPWPSELEWGEWPVSNQVKPVQKI